MDEKTAKQIARERLGDKRFQHSVNVRDMAVALAERYGADPQKAAVAALLHDSCKEMDKDDMLRIIQENAIIADNAENRPKPIWHGVVAAILAKTQWGVDDEEICSAISCHTTGKRDMSLLDKIVYMADTTSIERDYADAAYLRKLEMEDLDKALGEALGKSIAWVKKSGNPIDKATLEAYEQYGPQTHEESNS